MEEGLAGVCGGRPSQLCLLLPRGGGELGARPHPERGVHQADAFGKPDAERHCEVLAKRGGTAAERRPAVTPCAFRREAQPEQPSPSHSLGRPSR